MKSDKLREILHQELMLARAQTDYLFQMLAPGAIHDRPIPERHRIIFYLGHLEAFDWNMVCATAFGLSSFNSHFDRLFEFGIDPLGSNLPADRPSDWPPITEILSYRDRIRSEVDKALNRATFDNGAQRFLENGQIFRVAIEHRLMHAETLSYMIHWLDYAAKSDLDEASNGDSRKFQSASTLRSVTIPAGYATLGQDSNGGSFGWDNEFQSHSVFVPEFSIDSLNVTNQDFLYFIRAGGYEERSLWTDEGWSWLQHSGNRHPKFWVKRGEKWFYRSMFSEIPLPHIWPVYVSHAEATAYGAWKGRSLPTEAQYHRAAFGTPDGTEEVSMLHGNFNFRSWNPAPAGSFAPNSFGIFDLVGNGWEWTGTPFAAFAGFEPFPFYRGYSADFFDGKHFVLKGASPRTASQLVRRSFRNWFQAYYPNVYASFRCVGN